MKFLRGMVGFYAWLLDDLWDAARRKYSTPDR